MNTGDGKPTVDGWYWYSDPKRHFGSPMPAWVVKNGVRLYVPLCTVHEAYLPDRVVNLEDLTGTWSDPWKDSHETGRVSGQHDSILSK